MRSRIEKKGRMKLSQASRQYSPTNTQNKVIERTTRIEKVIIFVFFQDKLSFLLVFWSGRDELFSFSLFFCMLCDKQVPQNRERDILFTRSCFRCWLLVWFEFKTCSFVIFIFIEPTSNRKPSSTQQNHLNKWKLVFIHRSFVVRFHFDGI